MKLVKLMSIALVATSLGSVATVAAPTMNAQAKTKMSLKTIPKQFRGTWYHYENNGYSYQKISATKLKTKSKFSDASHYNQSLTIHQFDLNKGIKNTKTNVNNPHKWMFAYKSGSKYIMDSWDAYIYMESKYRSTYSMTTRNYKGKKVKVIKNTPTNSGTWYIYSPSKAMAKHLWNLDNK
ncbi:hypothetical protein [Lactiplantibacillus daowaiensis]|uniref:Extracellular protein n=1 Tax=Lactiplantibacillus daowaiensis TaxID=2559918 RepID=A0ABW1RWL2_9LACO|nr:hypothetical protein [Lactiplantibacillus daowaiensis]